MPSHLPLLTPRPAHSVFAWRAGQPIATAQYLADVAACAAALPSAPGPWVNLCVDRYAFAVVLGAALSAGRLSLLPPNARADTLGQLQARNPGLIGVTDDAALDVPGLPLFRWPAPAASPPAGSSITASVNVGTGPVAVPQVLANQPAACLLTSGSTGQPQPHDKTWHQQHLNVAAAAQRLAEHLGLNSLAGLAVVATVPPQHSYGIESSVLLAMLGGAAIDCGRPFYPADIAAALASVPRPRALVTTPFHLKALLSAGLALPPVDLVLSATAPLSPQLAHQSEAAFGGPLVEIYGCTEAGQVASRRTAQTALWHSFGELRISAGQGDDGAETFSVLGGHVLVPTPLSDVLELQPPEDAPDGQDSPGRAGQGSTGVGTPSASPGGTAHFRLLGRANDLVHVAGKRSSLGHLNHQLNSIPGVDDGAFWLPDDEADGVVRPVAFVVAPTLSAAQVRAGLRERLEAVFVPRQVVHVAALPREATGKLTVNTLRQFALHTLGGTP